MQCFGFSVLKLQCNLKMLDFQPTLALLLTHQMRSKCKNPLHVIWYNPWLPEKPLFTHMIFSKWTSEIFGSGRTNNPIVRACALQILYHKLANVPSTYHAYRQTRTQTSPLCLPNGVPDISISLLLHRTCNLKCIGTGMPTENDVA